MVSLKIIRDNFLSKQSVIAAALSIPIATLTLALAPAEWFLKVHSIRIVETADSRIAVIQARTVWPGDSLRVSWSAQIDRLDDNHGDDLVGRTVCEGSGVTNIRDDVFEIIRMPLEDWVGDPGCQPEPSSAHVAHASWTFVVLGFTKTATQRSAVFVPPYPNVALGG